MSFFTAGVCLIASHNNRHASAAMHSANPRQYEILDLCWYKTTIRSAYSADSKNFVKLERSESALTWKIRTKSSRNAIE